MNRRDLMLTVGGVLLVILFLSTGKKEGVTNPSKGGNVAISGPTKPTGVNEKNFKNKWAILTTINPPTEVVAKLAALPGWKVVVVGDKKTPAGWKHPGVDYISPEDQDALGYESTKYLPWNDYGRKNIGYLYAISKGADLIYETDDDNVLVQNGIVVFPEKMDILTYRPQKETSLNPYAYFGYPTVWPRGYPLDLITPSRAHPLDFTVQKMNFTIQQGLADLDPDVDAIFRLTRFEDVKKIRFHDKHPVVLPSGKMSPFNAQNTLFHYNSFWGLLMPVTTTIRVCDIWRGLWVQRLLWDIGGNLGFTAASVIQDRNPHNYLRDAKYEQDLYYKSGDFVQFLLDWKSTNPSFYGRMEELAIAMEQKQYWKQGDVDLMKAWIKDLQKVGYKVPRPVH